MANILFLAAHPDDVEVCAGGTLAKHVASGDNVEVVLGYMPSGVGTVRVEELMAAAEYLNYTPCQIRTGTTREMLDILEGEYPVSEIDRVYTMHVGDSHQEHREIARLAMAYCRDNTCDLIMCQPAIPGGITDRPFVPNMYVNIDEYIDAKRQAISLHKSQVDKYSPKRDWVEAIVARDRANGQLTHGQYAEAFEIIKITER